MKKIKVLLVAFLSLTFVTGCDDGFEELNQDPNNPTAVPAHLLLGGTQRILMNVTYSVLGGAGGDMGAMWAQLWSKVQYNDESRYVPRRGVIDGVWNTLYASIVSESDAMFDLAEAEGNETLQGVALVMKATGFQMLTELYGPIPFSEAVEPGILKPVYDDEAAIWDGILAMYTNASSLLASGNGSIVASSDLFYGGDASKWRKLANTLKFRALMRVSSTKSVGSELQALVNGGLLFSSSADDAALPYTAAAPDANPIYELIDNGARAEYKVNSLLVERMTTLNDPRLEVYAAPNASGVILGKPSGYGNQTPIPNEALGFTYANISALGSFYLNPELPGVLMSYSELNFLLAEAANEGLISGGITAALNYYNEGITASFAFNGLDATAYLAQPGLAFTTQGDAREKIAEQKWFSLFAQGFEAWTEWRRTQLPPLTPAVEGDINQIPSRYFYPTTEASLNQDNYNAASQSIGGDELTSALSWQ